MLEDAIKTFAEIGQLWIDDATKAKPSTVPDTVYHYTTAAGLDGALRSNKLWLTNYRYLNDSTESIFSNSILRTVINDRLNRSGPLRKDLYNEINIYQEIESDTTSFVFSLTSEKDDLSQWRGYANEGRGFTIGFSSSQLADLTGTSVDFFGQVSYEESAEERVLDLALSQFEAQLSIEDAKYPTLKRELVDEAGKHFDWMKENRASFVKHPSFRSENEWRLVSWVFKNSSEIKARISGDRVIPYVEVAMKDGAKLPITSIGVGPGYTEPQIVDAVRYLAANHGYSPNIYSANTPYRRP